ncbi:class I SAM-dependent methyltransferase [Hansschlegelia quercus]|nr:methyltransferase domain-containing protein [Hansschlegelia quercus]
MSADSVEFPWTSAASEPSHAYLLPMILELLRRHLPNGGRVLDVGSGNGSLTVRIAQAGYEVLGVEPSATGLALARARFPAVRFEQGDGYDDLVGRFGVFDMVVSCEVIEHLMTPATFLWRAREATKPRGHIVVSTPYHGFLKNVAVAASGNWDHHHHPERDYGHVKFFSRATLAQVARDSGLREVSFHRVGRIPPFAKSMVVAFKAAQTSH